MRTSLLTLVSFANAAAGLVLIGMWIIGMWIVGTGHVPVVVVFIGISLLVQGVYTVAYLRGALRKWGDLATGALFAGQALAACVGGIGLVESVTQNINPPNGDVEMGPVLAGLLMLGQALLTLFHLLASGRLQPRLS
ncbi:MAG TPA: hypothetical protein VNJ04_15080 [Gemmatimonadaceae bacterium]|nr:hypothetical protein [Gemmatimonadaceae bacterium]